MKRTRILSIVIILTIGCLNITASPSLQNNSTETKKSLSKEGYNPEKLKNCIWECNHSAMMFTDSFMIVQRYNFEIPKITKVHYYLSNNLKDSFDLSKVNQNSFGRLTRKDYEVINWALDVTGVKEFKFRSIDSLSGGQRQRVWIAMALAQETEIIFLDEPTTYLDMAHQLEVLELLQKLNREQERTVVMVLHDLNQAARFADYIIALIDGEIIKAGTCEEVINKDVLRKVFNIDAEIGKDPRTQKPMCTTYNLLKGDKTNEKITDSNDTNICANY